MRGSGLVLFLIITVAVAGVPLWAGAGQMKVATLASAKFAALPVLPACATSAVQNGDPAKGPSVMLLKATGGCTVPWHWHTANENLTMVSGKARLEMKDGSSHVVTTGDYLYLPAKQAHQFTCLTSCTLFNMPDAAFDIHYIDKDGKEIPSERALKTSAKPAVKTAAAKTKGQ